MFPQISKTSEDGGNNVSETQQKMTSDWIDAFKGPNVCVQRFSRVRLRIFASHSFVSKKTSGFQSTQPQELAETAKSNPLIAFFEISLHPKQEDIHRGLSSETIKRRITVLWTKIANPLIFFVFVPFAHLYLVSSLRLLRRLKEFVVFVLVTTTDNKVEC